MFKKTVLIISILCLIFSFTVCAEEKEFTLKAGDEFYTSETGKAKVCEILGFTEKEFDDYCTQNNIIYFAVNPDNTKQVKLSRTTTDFSSAVINISNFTDDKIISLLPDIVGLENTMGEVIDKNGQKFALVQLRSSDSGGDFILKEYITVADRKSYVLSFYTSADADDSYIEEIFETFESEDFVTLEKGVSAVSALKYILPIAVAIFAVVCVVIAVTIMRDIKKSKTENE